MFRAGTFFPRNEFFKMSNLFPILYNFLLFTSFFMSRIDVVVSGLDSLSVQIHLTAGRFPLVFCATLHQLRPQRPAHELLRIKNNIVLFTVYQNIPKYLSRL